MTTQLPGHLVSPSPADIETLRGWMPVDAVVRDGRPGLWWMNMQDVCLSEPFFQQTVERARAQRPGRGERFTEFDAVVQLENSLDSVAPTGFIFHSSRCGSTLVANACRTLVDSIVLSEAYSVDKLVARFITDAPEGGVKEMLYSVFLRGVVHALGQRRTGTEQHLFVKFSCCSIFQLDRIRRIWPDVPWVFLYRDPIETIVSNLTTLPEWMEDQDHRILAAIVGTSDVAIAGMVREELCARAVGSFYSTACRLANHHSMLLNYNQISVPVLLNVFEFFKVTPSNDEIDAVTRQSRIYAKETFFSRTFVADGEEKQAVASDLVRDMADKWAIEPYRLLERKRTEISNQVRNNLMEQS